MPEPAGLYLATMENGSMADTGMASTDGVNTIITGITTTTAIIVNMTANETTTVTSKAHHNLADRVSGPPLLRWRYVGPFV